MPFLLWLEDKIHFTFTPLSSLSLTKFYIIRGTVFGVNYDFLLSIELQYKPGVNRHCLHRTLLLLLDHNFAAAAATQTFTLTLPPTSLSVNFANDKDSSALILK